MFIQETIRLWEEAPIIIRDALSDAYRNNSDLISSVTNLALNSILLVSKIFISIPVIIPRIAFTLLSFSGIISINMQARNVLKDSVDLRLAIQVRSLSGVLLTAARVFVKSTNILLTCTLFGGSIVALAGFPLASLLMFSLLSRLSTITLIAAISGEFIDYFSKKKLLGRLHVINELEDRDARVQTIAQNFISMAYQSSYQKLNIRLENDEAIRKDQQLAANIVRNIDNWALEAFKHGLAAKMIGKNTVLTPNEAIDVYNGLIEAIEKSQTIAKANIGLRALGYISLGICKLYPQTILQYGITLAMSLFYTSKMVMEKYLLNSLRNHTAQA